MTDRSTQTRQRIIRSAYGLLYSRGYQSMSVDAVALAAGVTKRTLYNHFESKDALVGAVIAEQAETAIAEIDRWCSSDAATPAAFIRDLFDYLRRWSEDPVWLGSGFTRIAMELAWAPGHPARQAALAHKQAVEARLAGGLSAAGAGDPGGLAAALLVMIEGANALRLIHCDGRWYDVAESAALALAEERAQDGGREFAAGQAG